MAFVKDIWFNPRLPLAQKYASTNSLANVGPVHVKAETVRVETTSPFTEFDLSNPKYDLNQRAIGMNPSPLKEGVQTTLVGHQVKEERGAGVQRHHTKPS